MSLFDSYILSWQFSSVWNTCQTSASLGFIERVKFELFEMYNLKPSQAWVFPTSEILFKSSSSLKKINTQFRVVTILLWSYQAWVKFQAFWIFFFKPVSSAKLICFLLNCFMLVMAEFDWSILKLLLFISYMFKIEKYFKIQE